MFILYELEMVWSLSLHPSVLYLWVKTDYVYMFSKLVFKASLQPYLDEGGFTLIAEAIVTKSQCHQWVQHPFHWITLR